MGYSIDPPPKQPIILIEIGIKYLRVQNRLGCRFGTNRWCKNNHMDLYFHGIISFDESFAFGLWSIFFRIFNRRVHLQHCLKPHMIEKIILSGVTPRSLSCSQLIVWYPIRTKMTFNYHRLIIFKGGRYFIWKTTPVTTEATPFRTSSLSCVNIMFLSQYGHAMRITNALRGIHWLPEVSLPMDQ